MRFTSPSAAILFFHLLQVSFYQSFQEFSTGEYGIFMCGRFYGFKNECSYIIKIKWNMAEGVGFEPTVAFTTPVFKTGGLNRFPTPPCDGSF